MPKLRLSAALSSNAFTAPIVTEQVVAEGIDLTVSTLHPSEMFWRQLKFREFDISEMSLSSVTIAASHGDTYWVPIPVFTTRRFFHTEIVVRDDAGIDGPKDLVGKRVGVPEYQQTAAVWSRGALLHEFGVAPEELTWYMERPQEMSHGGATDFIPPTGVDLTYLPTTTNIGEMLRNGELDAALVYIVDNNLVDRSRQPVQSQGAIRTLFSDPVAEAARYYSATGLLPVNHTLVVRRTLLEEHPWLALNLYSAFSRAKQLAYDKVLNGLDPWKKVGLINSRLTGELTASDPYPYGLSSQRGLFETLQTYMQEQGLLARPVGLDELFAASTLDL